jgi:hypothetical protein
MVQNVLQGIASALGVIEDGGNLQVRCVLVNPGLVLEYYHGFVNLQIASGTQSGER